MNPARATIDDVAERSGVSRGTVSRVLAGSPRVLPATRERVLEAIKALDYRPSGIARSLRSRRTQTVGLIVTDITNPFYPEVVRGFEDAAQEIGLGVFLGNAAEDPRRELRYLELMRERQVDAVVVAAGGLRDRLAAMLREFPIPVVYLNAASPDSRIPSVVSTDREGGRMAAQHLIDLGHRHLLYVCGPREREGSSLRLEGIRDAVRAAGEPAVALATERGDGHLAGGTKVARAVASRHGLPYALICHNDLTAIGAMHALSELGIRIPLDVSVVGFDDIALTDYTVPPLTTVAQAKYEMGSRAVRMVARILAGETVSRTEELPVRLVVRRSTAPPRSTSGPVAASAPRAT